MKNGNFENIKSRLIKASGGKLSASDVDKIRGGDLKSLAGLLSAEEKKLLLKALGDKKTAEKILSGPAARDILDGNKKKN